MSEIAIIGAGIAGAFTAYLLADNGYKVVLYDARTLPYQATACNPGGINPLHGPGMPGVMADFYLSCHRDHLQHQERILELSGMDFGLRVIDRLFLAFTIEEKQALMSMQESYESAEGFNADWYTRDQVLSRDARISEQTVGGLFTHGNITVDSELYCEALIVAATELGARYVKSNVDELITQGSRVTHVVCEGERTPCSAAVLAGGHWTQRLAGKLGCQLPVAPLKGELLVVRLDEAPFDFDITWGRTGLYQYKDNLYWLGGTTEDPSINPGVSASGKAKIVDNVGAMLPGLTRYTLEEHSAGYRPVSEDTLPIVGSLPEYDNTYAVTGGGSKGILVSSGMGRVLVELIAGGSPQKYSFLRPDRFHAAR